MSDRRLSDFELRAELNRGYYAEHGSMPAPGFWLGDTDYLAEVRANRERREAEQARRRAADAERFKRLRVEHPATPSLRNGRSKAPAPSLEQTLAKPETPALELAPAPAALVLVPEAPMPPKPVSVRTTATFKPCVDGKHEACTGAYFDDAGAPVRCPCSCHVQGAMFSKPKPQGSLF